MNPNQTHAYNSRYGTVTVGFWHNASVCKVSLPAANRVTVNRIAIKGSLNFKHTPAGWQCLERETYLYRLGNGETISANAQSKLHDYFKCVLTGDLQVQKMRLQAITATVQDYETQIKVLSEQVNQHRAVIANLKQQTVPLFNMTTSVKNKPWSQRQQYQQH